MSIEDKNKLLDELSQDGLIIDEDKNELYDIVVKHDRIELERLKDTFDKNYREYYKLLAL